MTCAELFAAVDKARPNRFDRAAKCAWLAQIEGQLYHDIILTHEGAEKISEPRIDINTDPDHVLIARFPYDDLYVYWLESRIDLENMEIGKYNNSRTLFNNALISFRDYWNRTHMPIAHARYLTFREQGKAAAHDGRALRGGKDPLR